jgi:hypothetical protein
MVAKIIDEFKKLPLGNKMAYRRFFMQVASSSGSRERFSLTIIL